MEAGKRHFIIIGAMKAATTSLHQALAAHPSIAVPRRKELDFFSDPDRPGDPDRLARAYRRHFNGCDAPVLGEASPSYAMAPLHPGVPESIASVLPDASLIYCLRDPVERMRSHYRHEVLRSRERRPAREALDDEQYLVPSLYGAQLSSYRQHFDGAQIALVSTRSLFEETTATLTGVLEFLGLPATGDVRLEAAFTSDERPAFSAGTEKARSLPGMRAVTSLLSPSAKQAIARNLPGARRADQEARRLMGTLSDWEPPGTLSDALAADREVLVEARTGCVTVGEM